MNQAAAPMPALFVGHGSPMNTLTANDFTRNWRELGVQLPRPGAVLCISAHWYGPGLAVTAMPQPRTIDDFFGFPPELHAFRYPAPGSPQLAARVAELLSPEVVEQDQQWGLDHGAWSVLTHLFPAADVPVVQLSIDARRDPDWHLQIGRRLSALRHEGVWVLGSGNVVHNLRLMTRSQPEAGLAWAQQFDDWVCEALQAGDESRVTDPGQAGEGARLAIPTAEHYLPLLYVMGARLPGEQPRFVNRALTMGSLSMTSVIYGG